MYANEVIPCAPGESKLSPARMDDFSRLRFAHPGAALRAAAYTSQSATIHHLAASVVSFAPSASSESLHCNR